MLSVAREKAEKEAEIRNQIEKQERGFSQMEEKSMQEIMDKASVLIEALPYIQRFNRKIIVVKYGGSAMVD